MMVMMLMILSKKKKDKWSCHVRNKQLFEGLIPPGGILHSTLTMLVWRQHPFLSWRPQSFHRFHSHHRSSWVLWILEVINNWIAVRLNKTLFWRPFKSKHPSAHEVHHEVQQFVTFRFQQMRSDMCWLEYSLTFIPMLPFFPRRPLSPSSPWVKIITVCVIIYLHQAGFRFYMNSKSK